MGDNFITTAVYFHSLVAPRARHRNPHWLFKELEPLYFFDCIVGTLKVVKDDERLAFCLHILFSHDIDDIAEFRENSTERVDEGFELDAFF